MAVLCHSELKSHPNFDTEEVAIKTSDKEPMNVVVAPQQNVREADRNVGAGVVAHKRSQPDSLAPQQKVRKVNPSVEAAEAACKMSQAATTTAGPSPVFRVRTKSSQHANGQIVKKQKTDHPDVPSALVLSSVVAGSGSREIVCRGQGRPTGSVVCRGRGRPKGSGSKSGIKKDRPGKYGCISIASKLRIVKRYEELKMQGNIKNVESWLLKNEPANGFYQGCLSKTKWLGSRERQGWDSFVKHCPDLAKHASEVPSSFKVVIGKTVALVSLQYIYGFIVISFFIFIYIYI